MKKIVKITGLILLVVLILAAGVYFWRQKATPSDNLIKPEEINIDGVVLKDVPQQMQDSLNRVKTELKKDINNVDNLVSLAQYQKIAELYNDGIKTLKYAIQLDPTKLVAKNNLADLYYLNGQYEEAEKICYEMIKDSILWNNSYAFLRDIYKYHFKEKYSTDIYPNLLKEGLDTAAQLPDKKFFYLALIDYNKDQNNKIEAIKYGEEYLKIDPGNTAIKNLVEEMKK